MKINTEYMMRTIAGEKVIVPTGSASRNFNGLITLNDVAAFIWEHVDKVSDTQEMVNLLLENYDVDYDTAKQDVDGFLSMLREVNILID